MITREPEIDERTPIIIGVGRVAQTAGADAASARSTLDLAEEAVRLALADSGAARSILTQVDALVCLRSEEDTGAKAPFGKPARFPAALAARLGIAPVTMVHAQSGATVPLALLEEFGGRIASGEVALAVVVGAEASAIARALSAKGVVLDWSDGADAAAYDDRGRGLGAMQSRYATQHGIVGDKANYDLVLNAGEAQRAEFPAASPDAESEGAAVVLTSVGNARRMGLAVTNPIYFAGFGAGVEPPVILREQVARSQAADAALTGALLQAGTTLEDIAAIHLQGGAPVALLVPAEDSLGLDPADPRAVLQIRRKDVATLSGIAALVQRLRGMPPGTGLFGTDASAFSSYAAAVLSSRPSPWPDTAATAVQRAAHVVPKVAHMAEGWATVLTYAVVSEGRTEPAAVVMGVLEQSGERVYALHADAATFEELGRSSPVGRRVYVRWTGLGHRFALDRRAIEDALPTRKPALQPSYEYTLVERRGHVLEVTINRPEVRNCLVPEAHAELSDIFDAFEADRDLWVAIITGAGTQAFCAGNDLKYGASGKPVWLPSGGFGGLVARAGRTKPIIAAVNGFAYGGGFEIAMACDLVVADANARFALSEVKVGLIATGGGLSQLPRQVPWKLANELILTGRPLSAEEAERFGFVSRVEPAGEALVGARHLADAIAANSPTAIRLTLRAMREAQQIADPAVAALSTVRSSLIDELLVSEDMVEGVQAFAAKRPPEWKNR